MPAGAEVSALEGEEGGEMTLDDFHRAADQIESAARENKGIRWWPLFRENGTVLMVLDQEAEDWLGPLEARKRGWPGTPWGTPRRCPLSVPHPFPPVPTH